MCCVFTTTTNGNLAIYTCAQVTELRARLKATSTAFQTRENSVAELREAVHHLRIDLLAGQEKAKAQDRKLEEQVTPLFSVFSLRARVACLCS